MKKILMFSATHMLEKLIRLEDMNLCQIIAGYWHYIMKEVYI